MSEIYREQGFAILHQDDEALKLQAITFKVMADGCHKWNDMAIRFWVDLAFCRLGLPYRVADVVETGSIDPEAWRWFAVSVVGTQVQS